MALATLPEKHEDEDDDQENSDLPEEGRMSFLDHLDELRRRIIASVAAVAVGFLGAFAFIQPIFDFVMRPLHDMVPGNVELVYNEPAEAFLLQIQMAALVGLMIAMPVVLWQVWRFVAPGLYSHEKRFAVPFALMATGFFTLGAAFNHYVVFPAAWKFFASFANEYLEFTPRIEPAFSLYMKMALAMGVVFQVPTVVFFLARVGLVTAGWLWKNMKYAILVSFVLAAVLTPSADPVSQTLMAVPTIGLYVISIGIAWLCQKRPARDVEP
ncbi:MAG: twin-arginine translocase subunit TatC [Vicinamibacterales bacterium]